MIRFDNKNKIICIRTLNTEYRMQIVHENYLVHLYYGKKRNAKKSCYLEETVDFAPYVAKIGANFSLNTVLSELSFFDSGDLKDTAIKIKNENGDSVTLFLYRSHRIFPGREELPGMPYSRGACETLEIVYYDEVSGCELYSYYTVFEKSDTIVRYAKFKSCKSTVCLERALIGQLDLPNGDYSMVTLCGDYGAERHIEEGPVRIGLQGIYSKRGHSSHQFNPFLILKEKGTTENSGNAYAFEFVYSGDFEANVEKTFSGRYRIMMGLNRDTFSWLLKKGESFTTPETIMTYSANGLNRLSQNLHNHLREHIIPPKFAYSERPIVINTWEGVHFSIDEDVLLKYAEKAKKLGLDMLVIDDGWFGNRCNDAEGLGDWYVNHEKFRNGLAAFSEKIHKMGLKLGIWIEPEMISPHSELFRQHPDWVLCSKGRAPSLGRKQLVLDLTRDDVVKGIVAQLKKTFQGVQIDYFKWDFNRSLSEVGSCSLPIQRQGEIKHRFILGSYKMISLMEDAFPEALFEGCAGGGGRFDAGALYYFPQIWTSDNTDPFCRLPIQQGTALAYPLASISAHISDSVFNELESKPDYAFRCNVASEGILGCEMNLTQITDDECNLIRSMIERYRKIQPLVIKGNYFRLDGLMEGEYATLVVSKDKSEFLLLFRSTAKKLREKLKLCGLDRKNIYVLDSGEIVSDGELYLKSLMRNPSFGGYKYCCAYGKQVENVK